MLLQLLCCVLVRCTRSRVTRTPRRSTACSAHTRTSVSSPQLLHAAPNFLIDISQCMLCIKALVLSQLTITLPLLPFDQLPVRSTLDMLLSPMWSASLASPSTCASTRAATQRREQRATLVCAGFICIQVFLYSGLIIFVHAGCCLSSNVGYLNLWASVGLIDAGLRMMGLIHLGIGTGSVHSVMTRQACGRRPVRPPESADGCSSGAHQASPQNTTPEVPRRRVKPARSCAVPKTFKRTKIHTGACSSIF